MPSSSSQVRISTETSTGSSGGPSRPTGTRLTPTPGRRISFLPTTGFLVSLGMAAAVAQAAAGATEHAKRAVPPPDAAVPSVAELAARVRAAPVLRPGDPGFPSPLFVGGWYRDHFVVSSSTFDPMMPNTLDVYFDSWNVSARARLLVGFARCQSTPGSGTEATASLGVDGEGIEDAEQEERRIGEIVRARGYSGDWMPFVVAYRGFERAASRQVAKDALSTEAWGTFQLVDKVAMAFGLQQLAATARIEPTDVAREMLRMLVEERSKRNVVPNRPESGSEENLFYTCDAESEHSGNREADAEPRDASPSGHSTRFLEVHTHAWHPLARAFTQAWKDARASQDPEALSIVAAFRDLTARINEWKSRHPRADSIERDREVNRIAVRRGLISLLSAYGAGSRRHAEEPTVMNDQNSEGSKKENRK